MNADRVVLRARARPAATRVRLSPRPRKFDGLERQLAEEALELRHAGAEGQLVAVLLLELQLDVDLVRLARRLLDLDVLALPSSGLK